MYRSDLERQRKNNRWTNQDPRDHHALERTFVTYIRTSNAFVSLGVVIAQVYALSGVNHVLRLLHCVVQLQ